MLNLMEELLLLALDDEKGKIISSSSCALPYGLRGALLLELFLAEKIDIVDKKIGVIDKSNTGNEVLGFTLLFISAISIGVWAFSFKHYGMLLLQFFYATAGLIGVIRWL